MIESKEDHQRPLEKLNLKFTFHRMTEAVKDQGKKQRTFCKTKAIFKYPVNA
jgi:hypothetical protein